MNLSNPQMSALLHLQVSPRLYGNTLSWDMVYDTLCLRDLAVITESSVGRIITITAAGIKTIEDNDPLTGMELKAEGQAKALRNAGDGWREMALNAIFDVAQNKELFTMADVRTHGNDIGVPDPDHPNAWGALPRAAAKKGWIESTEQFRPSHLKSAHARMIRVWQSKVWRGSTI